MTEDEVIRWLAKRYKAEPKLTFIPPFTRLRFFLLRGYRCRHPVWHPGDAGREDGWRMIDLGRRQVRYCSGCEYAQFR